MITLGILIIVMVIILIVASIMKYKDQKRAEENMVTKYQENNVAQQSPSQPFTMTLSLEPDQEIISSQGGENGVLVSIGKNGKVDQFILIDMNGEIAGTINVSKN